MVLSLGRTAEAIKVNGRDAARVYANGRIVWPVTSPPVGPRTIRFTLTVAQLGNPLNYGYGRVSDRGALSPTRVRIDGTDYEIDEFYYASNNNQVRIVIDPAPVASEFARGTARRGGITAALTNPALSAGRVIAFDADADAIFATDGVVVEVDLEFTVDVSIIYANKLEEAMGNGGLFGIRYQPVFSSNQLRFQQNSGQGTLSLPTAPANMFDADNPGQRLNRLRLGNNELLNVHRGNLAGNGESWEDYLPTVTDNHSWYVWSEPAQQFYAFRANRAGRNRIGGGFVSYTCPQQDDIYMGFYNQGAYAGYLEGNPVDLLDGERPQVFIVAQNLIDAQDGNTATVRSSFREALNDLTNVTHWRDDILGVALLDNHDWRPY